MFIGEVANDTLDTCVTFLGVEGLRVALYGLGGPCVHRGGWQTRYLATPRPILT